MNRATNPVEETGKVLSKQMFTKVSKWPINIMTDKVVGLQGNTNHDGMLLHACLSGYDKKGDKSKREEGTCP